MARDDESFPISSFLNKLWLELCAQCGDNLCFKQNYVTKCSKTVTGLEL